MARVLVVDDDEVLLGVVTRMLEGGGYDVVTVADGAAAVESYRTHPADVVLMDLYMPGTDGVEALIRLRQQFPDVRIVAISGGGYRDKDEVLELARRLGAAWTLPKPLEKATLLTCLTAVLRM
jgi:two-component system, chemotaxis family, chemotaxis protein CheY